LAKGFSSLESFSATTGTYPSADYLNRYLPGLKHLTITNRNGNCPEVVHYIGGVKVVKKSVRW